MIRRGRRLLVQVRPEHGKVGGMRERRRPGQALVEQAAERVDVGAAVHLAARDLLRCDVGRRAQREPVRKGHALVGEPPGQAEVG